MQESRKMSLASQNLMSFTAEATGRAAATRSQSYTDEFLSRLECDDIKASAAAAAVDEEEDDYSDDEDHPLDVEVADAMLASIPRGGRRRRKKRRSTLVTAAGGGSLLTRVGACLAVSAVIAIVAVAIFAGVRKLPGRGDQQDAAATEGVKQDEGNNATSSPSFPNVPPPPPDLDVLCDVSNVETPGGYAQCEEACRPADCCFWHGDGANCRQEGTTNGEVCDEYESCVLALTAYNGKEDEEEKKDAARPQSFGPTTPTSNEPPTGVDELCSPARLASGGESAISACRSECHKRACCFSSGVLNCSAQRSSWCAEYVSCDNLQSDLVGLAPQGGSGGGSGGGSAAFEVEELVRESCSEDVERATPEGLADCHDVCLPGQCCFPEEDGSVRGCKDKDSGEFCAPYAGCAGIFRHFASSSGQKIPDPEEEEDDDVHPYIPEEEEDDDVHPHINIPEEEEDDDVHPHMPGPEEEEDDDVHNPNSEPEVVDDDTYDPYGDDRDPDADDDEYNPDSGNFGDGHGHGHGHANEPEPDADDDVYDAPRDPRSDDDDYTSAATTHEPPLQVKIALACSDSKLGTDAGTADCYQVCEAGACCFPDAAARTNASSGRKDEESAEGDCSADYCNSYAGCERYYRDHHVEVSEEGAGEEPSTTTTTVRDQIAASCSPSSLETEEGRSACADACIAGSCCFPDPDEVGDVDCSTRAGGFCLAYAGCGDYYREHGWQQQSSSPPAPVGNEDDYIDDDVDDDGGIVDAVIAEVEEACAPDKLRSALGLEECKMVCAERACCFEARGGPFSCYAEMTRWCVEYEGPCRAMIRFVEGLDGSGGGADSAVSNNSGGPVAPDGSMISDVDDDVMEEAHTGVDVEDDDVVKEDDIGDDDVVKEAYMEEAVEDDDVVENDDAVENDDDVKELDEYAVSLVCTEDKLSTAEGRSACEELCSERACCFEEGQAGCYDARPVWCEEYIACNALYIESTSGGDAYQDDEGTANDVSGANVKAVCSPEHVRREEGLVACTKLCSERSCCFMGDGPGSCRTDRRGWCSEYSACEGVYVADPNNLHNEPTFSNEAKSIQAACADESLATSDGLILCTELCSKASCCFAQGSESCYDDRMEWCDEYRVCEGVYIGDTSTTMENAGTSGPVREPSITSSMAAVDEEAITLDEASDINVACSAESLNTSAGLILCTGLCNERACCFMRGTASCYGGKSEWCDEYKICDSVYIDGNT